MDKIKILESSYSGISDAITNRIDSVELNTYNEQIKREFLVKNGDLHSIYNSVSQMIMWFDCYPIIKNNEKFVYNTLLNMMKIIDNYKDLTVPIGNNSNKNKKLLISHSCKDKKYCDALLHLLCQLGIDDENIIYTSNTAYGVPMGERIFDYLKEQFSFDLYVLYVFSCNYFESAASLNEMGAAWIKSSKFTVLTVPEFNYDNKKFNNCVVDSNSIAGNLSDAVIMTQLKDKLIEFFELRTIPEQKWLNFLKDYNNYIS